MIEEELHLVAFHHPYCYLPHENDHVPLSSSLLAVHANGVQSFPVAEPFHTINMTGVLSGHILQISDG